MVSFCRRALVVLSLFVCMSSAYGETKVVVIPLFGDDAASQWKGTWQEDISYKLGDIVEDGGSSFIALSDHSSELNDTPLRNPLWDLVAASGANGIDGQDGPQGPAGIDGAIGETGPAGADGATGSVGPQGPAGFDGAIGETGPAGADGATGSVGPQGLAGVDGAIGETGPAGADGATGSVGPQGPAGVDGAIGETGPAGADGATGSVGPQGPAGVDGAIGETGPAGADGATGSVGPQGPAGVDGAIGEAGPAGADGVTGPAGADGATGVQGLAGAGCSLSQCVDDSATLSCGAPVVSINVSCISGPVPDRLVFRTKTTTDGSIEHVNSDGVTLTGIAAADSICQSEADDAGVTGSFIAWLSSEDTSESVLNNFSSNNGLFVNYLGETIAHSVDDLTDGNINLSIDDLVDGPVPSEESDESVLVWTGTQSDGSAYLTRTCSSWTDNTAANPGNGGIYTESDAQWTTFASPLRCSNEYPFYCFEQ